VKSSHILSDPATGVAFLNVESSQSPDFWFNCKPIAYRVISDIVRMVGVSTNSTKGPPPLSHLTKIYDAMFAYMYKGEPMTSLALSGCLVKPPRPTQTGHSNWIFCRQPIMRSDLQSHRRPISIGKSVVYDSRFSVSVQKGKAKPPTPTQLLSPLLKARAHLDINESTPLVVRELTPHDIEVLKSELRQSKLRAHYMYNRTLRHYLSKMPKSSWCTIPVIATQADSSSKGIVLSVPSLAIHLLPHVLTSHIHNVRIDSKV
jgi:hypothetical protein